MVNEQDQWSPFFVDKFIHNTFRYKPHNLKFKNSNFLARFGFFYTKQREKEQVGVKKWRFAPLNNTNKFSDDVKMPALNTKN